ncbi:alpha-2-macroglobulin [Lewinella sp. 4G2]|uniref:alpha-2-macroglobulin family protein n=1 Tax=Lewinella sp. 4G2 TaxID=1803372 RepID=UPI0007B4764A|nr:alpha-2-macroglobulin family protein [Lewinella sp. 4G2]OAV43215.1 hypothetical protein A3850_001310 [Lewinella sp. 4G2]
MRHLIFLITFLFSSLLMAQDYSQDYREIEKLANEGKYRSALQRADDLYGKAASAGDEDDIVKALMHRAAYTLELEEEGAEATLKLLLSELAANRNRPVVSPILNYLIGKGYYAYAQQQSYRLRNATATTDDTPHTIDTPLEDWNLRQLADAADRYLYAAIREAGAQRTRLSALPAIVRNPNNDPQDATLFDALTEDIGNLLNNPLLVVNNTAPAAAPAWLAAPEDFVALDFSDLDEQTGPARRLKLHQEQLRYHLKSGGEGLLRADYRRLVYVRQLGAKAEDYLSAIDRSYARYAGVRGRDLFLLLKANLYVNQPPAELKLPLVKALEVLELIKDQDAEIQNDVQRLRANITAQSLSTTAQKVYREGRNILLEHGYRNVTAVHHRLYRLPESRYVNFSANSFDDKVLKKLLRGTPVAEKTFDLPANDDYQPHRTETWLPEQRLGAYVLLTSYNGRFNDPKSLGVTPFQVSGLALVKFDDGEEDYYEVQDLTTGAPRPGVEVTVFARENRRSGDWKQVRSVRTDQEGRFTVPNVNRQQIYITLRRGEDVLITPNQYVYDNDRRNRNRETNFTPLFTDRAIYRPGQTVHVYGITMLKDRRQMPSLLTGEERKIQLRDANYQEVEVKTASSDEYGRFNVSFVLPESGLTGVFRLETDGGGASFRVEEYKRPRFQVELEGPDYVVGGEAAEITGQANLFAGPAVNDAKVNYRVFVEQRRWYWWSRGGGSGDRELVSFGETETDEDGAFSLSFTPDENLAKRRIGYQYIIEVDVADATGETHSASTTTSLRSTKPSVGLSVDGSLEVGDTLTIKAAGSDESLAINYSISRVSKPDATLENRKWGFPDRPLLSATEYRNLFPQLPAEEPADLKDWPVINRVVSARALQITEGKGTEKIKLDGYAPGHYRIDWAYPDGTAGEPLTFTVSDLEREQLPEGMLYTIERQSPTVQPGQAITFKLVAAEALPHITYSFLSRRGVTTGKVAANKTATISYVPTDEDRGGIVLDLAFVHGGELHQDRFNLDFGWENKELSVDYATFRDKLRPGTPETWTLTIRNADGSPVNAAALASMYDMSLDQITPANRWSLSPYPGIDRYRNFASMVLRGSRSSYVDIPSVKTTVSKDAEQPELDLSPFSWNFYGGLVRLRGSRAMVREFRNEAGAPAMEAESMMSADVVEETALVKTAAAPAPATPNDKADQTAPEGEVSLRKNLQETAFWLPELTTNDGGDLVVSFTSPEALTRWRFRVLTHDQELNYGYSEREIVTQKELMILPNVPRFLREGDALELTARVNNLTEQDMRVRATIEFFNPETNEVINVGAAAGAGECIEEQIVGANSGKTFCFPLNIPDGFASRGPLGYRVIARAGSFSDGEENVFPVLTDRTLITVSQAFYLKKNTDKEVTLPLLDGYDSNTLQHVGYTFEATTNPAWMALKALPYLMEYPYDCTEQVANRYFANQLAFVTVSDKPVLEEVFRKWQADPDALKSELERNPTLKNALLTETPWVRAAQSEAEQRARIANLFDLKTLAASQTQALDKLAKRQDNGGYYSWFPGGPENRYITQYVVETLARMRQLGVITPDQTDKVDRILNQAVRFLDQELAKDYRKLMEREAGNDEFDPEAYRPGSLTVHYLYARALAGTDPVEGKNQRQAYDFYRKQVLKMWTDYGLYEQALVASMGAAPGGDAPGKAVAQTIVESLRERAIRKDEFGMYWKYGRGYRWSQLPLETHCRILEAFQLAGGTTEETDEMRLWLLTNKRTNRWPTTKSTAAAVYALLNSGSDWTAKDGQPIQVSWPQANRRLRMKQRVRETQASAEAATGSFKVSLSGDEVTRDLASVSVKNSSNDLVWGGVYWQYTELATKVEASNDGPLTLERQLFHRIATEDGIRLDPITADHPLQPGDRVTVRLIVRSDRDMDYVHLKDRRAATFEPVQQLSRYEYQNGLGYYAAPGDLATNFFLDNLPKGTHTIEYDLFATFSGSFSNGLGRIQCMYAPEFGANTSGAMISVASVEE